MGGKGCIDASKHGGELREESRVERKKKGEWKRRNGMGWDNNGLH
jgi:hypothetical protein